MSFLAEIPESEATGTVAEAYADIRRVLGAPFVVFIYRVLATEPGRLEAVWSDLGPNLGSAEGRRAIEAIASSSLQGVTPISRAVLEQGGLDGALAAGTLEGFRMVNSANIVGLSALLAGVEGPIAAEPGLSAPHVVRPALPMADLSLLPATAVALLEEMSAPVAGTERPILVPSLYRTFAHDEKLLTQLWATLRPVLESAAFPAAVEVVAARGRTLAASLPYRVRRLEDEETRAVIRRFLRAVPSMLLTGSLLEVALSEILADSPSSPEA